ncbi:MAG: signal peptide peptidase SppA [Alloprevotella sp.]|nr:signal peptide peptidase SppA [Alloprevotella sp.]
MKDFLKYTLATIVGLFIASALCFFFFIFSLVSSIGTSQQETPIENHSILKINLKGSISDEVVEDPLAIFESGSLESGVRLIDLVTAIKDAANDKRIDGIYLDCGEISAEFATLEELRSALDEFKQSGKFIVAYADTYTQGSYYVASVAQKVLINPEGILEWQGLASMPIFYKELLEKVGVKVQLFRVGTYKSAVEPFTLTSMSPANREMVESMIQSIWKNIVGSVSASRNIPEDSLQALADKYIALTQASDYVDNKLVDQLAYYDEVRDILRRNCGDSKVTFTSPQQMMAAHKPSKASDKIAIYFAEGDIVSEATNSLRSRSPEIASAVVVNDLDKLANDNNIKAVVIRVNSGGGSAYASEQLWRAVENLKKTKKVIVSMGGFAASGGYYMSCGADKIIADPTTLTGSIGIFGLIPDYTELMENKLGLHYDAVRTNKGSDLISSTGRVSSGGAEAMQAYIDRGYQLFLSRVAQGRKMTTEQVDSIAQGRVWTGEQALEIGLVDKLGNLDTAIKEAAQLANLKDYGVVIMQKKASLLDALKAVKEESYLERDVKALLGDNYKALMLVKNLRRQDQVQARIPFFVNFQ